MNKELRGFLGCVGLLLILGSIFLGVISFIGALIYAVDLEIKSPQYLKDVKVVTPTEMALFYSMLTVMFFIGIFLAFLGFASSETNKEPSRAARAIFPIQVRSNR
jgi:uncharacterized membrane protein YkvI